MVAPVSSGVRSAKRVRVCQALSTGAGLPVSAMNELQMGSPPPPSWARPQSQLLELSPTARLCRASGRGSQAAAATLEALRASFPLRPLASSLDCITRGRAWGALDAPPPPRFHRLCPGARFPSVSAAAVGAQGPGLSAEPPRAFFRSPGRGWASPPETSVRCGGGWPGHGARGTGGHECGATEAERSEPQPRGSPQAGSAVSQRKLGRAQPSWSGPGCLLRAG